MKSPESKGFGNSPKITKNRGKKNEKRLWQDIAADGSEKDSPTSPVGSDSGIGSREITGEGGIGGGEVPSEWGGDSGHWQEFQASGICPDVAALNFQSLSGDEAYRHLLVSDELPRRNDGRVSESVLKRYRHLEAGGWWCGGVDLLSGGNSEWGCFKPATPRTDGNGKLIKYEHPPQMPTEIFALKIPPAQWELISRRYSIALPDNYEKLPPFAFWQWVINHPQIPIIIGEGAKKAACVISLGYVFLALPGVHNGYRTPKDEFGEPCGESVLIPQLKLFLHPERRIYFCFDQDSKRTTIRNVNQALSKTAKLFLKGGCKVKVITWHPSMGKGIDDVVFAHGQDIFDDLYANAISFDEWQTRQLKKLTYPVDLQLNQRYLGEFLPPANAQLICLKAPKGTGKTQWFQWITDPLIRSGERKVLVLTHRVQLGSQIVERLGLPFVNELRETGYGSSLGMGLCIDSLHASSAAKFNPDEWKGCWVVIDEIMQFLWHLLNSRTCQQQRVIIIKNLKQLLLNAVQYGGKILIADADLNDIAIDFIKGLIGYEINPWIVKNEYKFEEGWEIFRFNDKQPSRMMGLLVKRLLCGEKALLCLSGQKAKSKWGSINTEAHFKKIIPELKILRIDSESVADKNHPAFNCTSNIDEIIKDYDLVIATPTIETGVSIDEKHFDGVWGVFQGVQTTDSVRQHLSRYRPPVPRYVWIKSFGINRIGNGATSVKALLAGEHKKDKANRNRLIDAGFEESLDGDFEPVCLHTWAKMACIINQGMYNYSSQIISDLQEEGHTIVDVDEDTFKELPTDEESKDFQDELKATRDENYLTHREEVTAAESITDEKFERLSRQQAKVKSERLEYQKGELERLYGVEITPELIEKNDSNWYPQVRLHYYYEKGRDFLADRDKNVMSASLKNGDGDYFKPDTNRSLLGKKIDALDFLNIKRLMEAGEFSETHPVIEDIFEKCQQNIYSLKLILGIDFSQEERPINACQRLLKLIGYKLPFLRREGSRGAQKRIYGTAAAEFERDEKGKILLDNGRAIPVPDGRDEIFGVWLERDALAREKAEKEKERTNTYKVPPRTEVNWAAFETENETTDNPKPKDNWYSQENLEESADLLRFALEAGREALADLRCCIPNGVLRDASRLLEASQKAILKQWVLELNSAA